MSSQIVLVEAVEGVATVTLNRPEKLNAFNREMRSEFCRVMQQLGADEQIGAVIITGAGRAFSAGLDLKELGGPGPRENQNATFISVVEEMEVPVIAAVNGFAITGGLELVLACDLIVAATDAQFADTHARVGVMPGGGMSVRLPRAIGIRKAKELSLTGNYLGAEQAYRMGMVNRVVPRDQLRAEARKLAEQIMSCDHGIVRQMKRLIDVASRAPMGEGLRIEHDFFTAFNRSRRPTAIEARRESVMQRGRLQSVKKA